MKLSLVKLNLFYLQTTQRKGKKGDGCTGEKTINSEIYIMFQTHKDTFFFFFLFCSFFRWVGEGGSFVSSLTWKIHTTPPPPLLSLSLFFFFFLRPGKTPLVVILLDLTVSNLVEEESFI